MKKTSARIIASPGKPSVKPVGRIPLQNILNVNDDTLEKKQRRMKKKIVSDEKRAIDADIDTTRDEAQHDKVDKDAGRDLFDKDMAPLIKAPPVLARFEEWMKIATDNKINALNSWNFALIDYFHDMSLLKEDNGGINFQKASCTLDGCVKIYTSRVDSVATEIGRLLSGLADGTDKSESNSPDKVGEGDEDEDEEKEKKRKKRSQRSENTLVKDFSAIQVRKLELEVSIDPLFRKTSADFDEGGAKGLLLNNLSMDAEGRVLFDAGDETGKSMSIESNKEPAIIKPQIHLDISELKDIFAPHLSDFGTLEVCRAMRDFKLDSEKGIDVSMLPGLSNDNDDDDVQPADEDEDEADGLAFADRSAAIDADMIEDTDSQNALEAHEDLPQFGDAGDTIDFGQGGENWANDSINEGGANDNHDGDVAKALQDVDNENYLVGFANGIENVFSVFDKTLQKNWAGPEHWRIQRLKNANNKPVEAKKRKEKEVFSIDFLAEEVDIDSLFAPGNAIRLPKTQWKSKTRHLLPPDIKFTSQRLIQLFLKPNVVLRARSRMGSSNAADDMDPSDGDKAQNDYNAQFFHGDDNDLNPNMDLDDQDDFHDAAENFDPFANPREAHGLLDAPNANLVSQAVISRRARPEYVEFAKTAKRVDVRKLKENIWDVLEVTDKIIPEKSEIAEKDQPTSSFTSIVENLKDAYQERQMNEISTSFCFICLLHLANEKGLVIENTSNYTDLTVRKDMSITEGMLEH